MNASKTVQVTGMTSLEKLLSEVLLDAHTPGHRKAEQLLARLGLLCAECCEPVSIHTSNDLAAHNAAQVELAWSLMDDGEVCRECGVWLVGLACHADDCPVGYEIEADRASEQNIESWDR